MKAEHRHELKTNELAQWLADLPQWAKKNLRWIIYGSVVLTLVIASYIYHSYQKNVVSTRQEVALTRLLAQTAQDKIRILQAQFQGVDISYMLVQRANDLENIAKNAKDNNLAASAFIKQAEILRTELHYRLESVSQSDLNTQINRAKQSYNNALEKAAQNPPLAATAKLGLALCDEELGNFEAARKTYDEIAENPQYEGASAASEAEFRLRTMDNFAKKLVFNPAPRQLQPEPAQPAEELGLPQDATTGQNIMEQPVILPQAEGEPPLSVRSPQDNEANQSEE